MTKKERKALRLWLYDIETAKLLGAIQLDLIPAKLIGHKIKLLYSIESAKNARRDRLRRRHRRRGPWGGEKVAFDLNRAVHNTQFPSDVSLSVKISIGFSKCKIVFVGGTLDR